MARKPQVEDALLSDIEAQSLKEEVGFKLRVGKNYWRPLHLRQDYWATMYLLLDPIQQMKPLGYRRFISNEPRTALDAAVSILTRNESFWRIEEMDNPNNSKEDRRTIGKIERMLQGVINDADLSFTRRGLGRFWKRVAQQVLLRGWVWGKIQVTTAALPYRRAPLMPVIYDSRTVIPKFDEWGLAYVIIETMSSLGDLAVNYPDVFPEYLDLKRYDPNTPAIKIEYWSNDRLGTPGVTGVMGVIQAAPMDATAQFVNLGAFFENPLGDQMGDARWIIAPYAHGYTPDQLPVVGVPANSLSIETKPSIAPLLSQQLEQRADLLSWMTQAWTGPGTWQADSGRGILSAVEDQVPQYNELIATIFHHFSIGAFGTHIFHTPTGEIPNVDFGIESKIALRPEEQYQRAEIGPVNADAYRLMQLLQDEKQRGVLSNVLSAATGFQGTGVLFQQIANAALNSVEPYLDSMKTFGMLIGTSVLEQVKAASDELEPFQLIGLNRSRSRFTMEFDPKTDLVDRFYMPVPVFKPALPDDLAIRINAARLALDPRRPILSLKYVLENIIQVDDTQGEIDGIWEDLANSDPVIMLEQLAIALEKMGELEIADRLRQAEFKARFVEDMQWRQMTGAGVPGLESGPPQNLPPEAGGGQFNAQQNGQGDEGALRQEGAAILGAMGERGAV